MHHQREFADLAQIYGWKQACAQPLLQQIERRKGRDEAADHREKREQQGPSNKGAARDGNRHAQADEKQRHKKISAGW